MTSASSSSGSSVAGPSPEQRRAAAGQFERANQVVATGNYNHGIQLLFDCCRLDPANLVYRQALRRAEKAKFGNNLRGSFLAGLLSWPDRARLKAAQSGGRHLDVLQRGERILMRNPWDASAQGDMARSAIAMGLVDLAVWLLEQARHKQPADAQLNRDLARLYERRGNFTQALALWQLVGKAVPDDPEAQQKLTELPVRENVHPGKCEECLARTNDVSDRVEFANPPGGISLARVEHGREAALLRARLQEDPTSAAVYLQLARLYRRDDQFQLAHATLTEGLAATGNAFELMTELADLEIEPFRRDLVLAEEKRAAQPDDEELRNIGLHLRKEINTRELDLHRLRADRFPNEPGHRYEVGVRLLRSGQVDEAIRELQSARADPRFRWQSSFALGQCFKARNNARLAQRNFEEALDSLPPGETNSRKDILYELARGRAGAGDLAKALELAQELAHVDFAYRDISTLMDEWQTRLQQTPA